MDTNSILDQIKILFKYVENFFNNNLLLSISWGFGIFFFMLERVERDIF